MAGESTQDPARSAWLVAHTPAVRDHPLVARAGQWVRPDVVDAGPDLPSAFHVIGGIFDAVYTDGDPADAFTGVPADVIAPGQGVVFDLVFR